MSHVHVRTWATMKSDYIYREVTTIIKYISDQSYSDIFIFVHKYYCGDL